MHIFHKWSKWSEPYNTYEKKAYGSFGDTSIADITRQMKICKSCGFIKTRLVEVGHVADILLGSIGEDEQCQLDRE